MNGTFRRILQFVIIILLFTIPVEIFARENYLHLNKVIAKLEQGKLVTGIWCLSRSLSNARSIIEYNGFPSQEEAMNKPMIKQALDVGVHGVVIPHVRTPEEALKIVRACRYVRPENSPCKEPRGSRGYAPAIAAYLWGLSTDEYYRRADVWPLNPDGDILVILIIGSDIDKSGRTEKVLEYLRENN